MTATAKDRLTEWFEKEKRENDVVDVKFYPGNTSQENVESFCGAVLRVLEAEQRGDVEEIAAVYN